MNHESLFGLPELTPVPVVMSLDDQWYQRMWNGQKSHEYRRRYVTGAPTQWFVYLAAPESRLCAVIDLGRAVEGSPQEIARLAEREHPGDGAPVLDYLAKGRNRTGYAMPILRIREFAGFTASELDPDARRRVPPAGGPRPGRPGVRLAYGVRPAGLGPGAARDDGHRGLLTRGASNARKGVGRAANRGGAMPTCDHQWVPGPNSGTEQCSNCGAIRSRNY
ncbi:hypothetical protein [Nocardiopsis sp. NPDC006938]|uniref:hypothetical protein n=1 Tax=Nocardiopsis sp. NPDC006938 TaxID=3364337 RepID=UPI0036C354BE